MRADNNRRWIGLAAVAFVAYALCDLLHEAGHAAATFLPLGVQALSISTVAVATSRSNPVVAAAGSLINLALGSTLLLSFRNGQAASARYFWWLFGSLNLFNATGYLLYSAVSDSGDLAVTLGAIATPLVWRPFAAAAGLVLYAAAIKASLAGLRQLVRSGAVPSAQVEQCCMVPYWAGGLLLMAGAALNPTSHWLILTSGAAVGFGAMVGLTLLPRLHSAVTVDESTSAQALQPGWPWLVWGALTALIFVALFGPGVPLAH